MAGHLAENTGDRSGDEVVQLYLADLESSAPVPIRTLKGFERIQLEEGEKQTVTFELHPVDLSLIDANTERVVEPGSFRVSVGGKQPGFGGIAATPTSGVVQGTFQVSGEGLKLPL